MKPSDAQDTETHQFRVVAQTHGIELARNAWAMCAFLEAQGVDPTIDHGAEVARPESEGFQVLGRDRHGFGWWVGFPVRFEPLSQTIRRVSAQFKAWKAEGFAWLALAPTQLNGLSQRWAWDAGLGLFVLTDGGSVKDRGEGVHTDTVLKTWLSKDRVDICFWPDGWRKEGEVRP